MWLKWVGIVFAILIAACVALVVFGRMRWHRASRQLLQRLDAADQPGAVNRYREAAELAGLPPPVQRYFRATLRDGCPIVRAVDIAHAGTFNLSADAEQWKPFVSTQRVIAHRPGFLWDARIDILPGAAVHVHDAYIAGEGILRPAVLGVIALTEHRGGGEIAQGELMRFLAEAAWYPTALLPSQGVTWQAIDDRSAKALLRDDPLALELTFRFRDDGLIDSVRSETRGRTLGNSVVPTPWEGHWSDYALHEGMRIPMTGEVAWVLPEGRKPYWRGRVTALKYTFAQ
jgi:hypothetical protein